MATFVRGFFYNFFEIKYFRGGQNVIILRIINNNTRIINNVDNKEGQKIIVVREKDLFISIYSTDLYSTTYKLLQNIKSQEL